MLFKVKLSKAALASPRSLLAELQCACACCVAQSCLNLCNLIDCRAPGSSSMGFSRQEYWSGSPCPPPGDLSNTGIEPESPVTPAQNGFFTTEPPGKPSIISGCTPNLRWQAASKMEAPVTLTSWYLCPCDIPSPYGLGLVTTF